MVCAVLAWCLDGSIWFLVCCLVEFAVYVIVLFCVCFPEFLNA